MRKEAKYKIEYVDDPDIYFYSDSWLWCKITLWWFNRRMMKFCMRYRNP